MVELNEARLGAQRAKKEVGKQVVRCAVAPLPYKTGDSSGDSSASEPTVLDLEDGWEMLPEGPSARAGELAGQRLAAVETRGKHSRLTFEAADGALTDLLVHMGQNATMLVVPTAGYQQHLQPVGWKPGGADDCTICAEICLEGQQQQSIMFVQSK